jgi:hypothetical protein
LQNSELYFELKRQLEELNAIRDTNDENESDNEEHEEDNGMILEDWHQKYHSLMDKFERRREQLLLEESYSNNQVKMPSTLNSTQIKEDNSINRLNYNLIDIENESFDVERLREDEQASYHNSFNPSSSSNRYKKAYNSIKNVIKRNALMSNQPSSILLRKNSKQFETLQTEGENSNYNFDFNNNDTKLNKMPDLIPFQNGYSYDNK